MLLLLSTHTPDIIFERARLNSANLLKYFVFSLNSHLYYEIITLDEYLLGYFKSLLPNSVDNSTNKHLTYSVQQHELAVL